jgi:putative transposase
MKKSRFTDSQIMSILKQAEAGTPVAELCREHGMSNASFYKWRSRFGGMDASMMTRLKELEDENRRLKKMYAEERLKAEIIQEAMAKSGDAIESKADGAGCSQEPECQHTFCLPVVCCQRKLLSLSASTE